MAERKEIIIRATAREGRGKNDARRARRNGQVPVTIYGGATEAVAALAPLSELAAILRSDTGRNTIFTVDIDGVEATRAIRSDPDMATIPIVAVTSFSSYYHDEAIEAGCNSVIEKPSIMNDVELLRSVLP